MNLQTNFQTALQKFVSKYKTKKEVIGIFLTGSFVHSKPEKNSDLDVYILTKSGNFRERGNTWIDGVEIEYFINSVKQVNYYFQEEKLKGHPATAHMFVNSKILYEKGNELRSLMKKAQKFLNLPRNQMSKVSKELVKYQIDDLEKDLEDVYEKKDDFAFEQISMKILEESLEAFLKIKRKNDEKSKRLLPFLEKLDPYFSNLYSEILLAKISKGKFEKLRELVHYIEDLLDGKRSKEWKLRSKCTYLNKNK